MSRPCIWTSHGTTSHYTAWAESRPEVVAWMGCSRGQSAATAAERRERGPAAVEPVRAVEQDVERPEPNQGANESAVSGVARSASKIQQEPRRKGGSGRGEGPMVAGEEPQTGTICQVSEHSSRLRHVYQPAMFYRALNCYSRNPQHAAKNGTLVGVTHTHTAV